MKVIELPRYSWFYSNQQGKYVTNAYSGSRGTSNTNGCLCNVTFNYRVFIKMPEGEESYIQAECFFISSITDGGEKSEIVTKKFENSEKGLEEASVWLSHQDDIKKGVTE
ncbi:MAG: hypothetical protein E7614_08270 [Ruminococcaceae bacterium]|nr:hypothetical protein [Oscillospiraceae bacterium]